ncbi:unnamed protein product, partial [Aureobasidium pullulans]
MTSLAYAHYTVDSAPIEALSEPPSNPSHSPPLSTTSSDDNIPTRGRLDAHRPRLGSRKSSGTMIIPRDSPRVEMAPGEEEYEPDDVRSMSPRRTSEVIEKLGEDARRNLIEYVSDSKPCISQALRASLMAIVDRVEAVKIEHEKLEGGNKFLQS